MDRRRRKIPSPAAAPASNRIRQQKFNAVAPEASRAAEPIIAGPPAAVVWLMVAISGFACLVYQILWMRQVALLFGNTSQAAALTLAVFFGGMALGGWSLGVRSQALVHPFRTYAWLEIGIAIAGIMSLVGPVVVPAVYPIVADEDGRGWALTLFRIVWTMVLVFPASFLMGGTLPVLGQAVIRGTNTFGNTAAWLYAVNTIGAAAGAFAAAFLLIGLVGIRMTCLTAMATSLMTAVLAVWLSRWEWPAAQVEHPQSVPKRPRELPVASARFTLPRMLIVTLACMSGFNLLALEVVWTRMLAQVHENSVYSFATVLIVMLLCLALGAWLASQLARGKTAAPQVLVWLILAGGIALGFAPLVFVGVTHGMRMLETDSSFAVYGVRLFAIAVAVIGPACIVLGTVFPFLMKCEESFVKAAGRSIGQLAACNTLGAILGSLAAGFLLLDWMGVWGSIQVITVVYLLLGFAVPAGGMAALIARGAPRSCC